MKINLQRSGHFTGLVHIKPTIMNA